MRTLGVMLMVSVMLATAQPTRVAGRHAIEFPHGGHKRTVDVHVPMLATTTPHPPLVIVLHGAGGSGDRYLDNNSWATLAEEEGCIVAAPNGLPASPDKRSSFAFNPTLWNSGLLKEGSERASIDDVVFLSDLLDSLIHWYDIDPQKVFVTGHSNGAGMTFRFAAERSERITAIAPVAGHCWIAAPAPARPMPTLFIIGELDPLVPYNGGDVRLPWGRKQKDPPVLQTLQRWAAALGCSPTPTEPDSSGTVRTLDFGKGNGNSSLVAYIVKGQGHGWPGGDEAGLPERMIGPKSKTLDATRVIWKFFSSIATSKD